MGYRNHLPIRQKMEYRCCLIAFALLAFIRVRLNLLSLYGVLSDYGESVWLPTLWSLFLIVASAGIMLFHKPFSFNAVVNATAGSASIFLFAEQPQDWPGLLERLFGLLFVGMLLIALRRRFLRYQ